MIDNSSNNNNKKRKEFISEADIATLLQRYDTMTILKLLQEMAYYAEQKMDWNELVKKTTTGITNAREYQLLWRHLAYKDSLLPMEESTQLLDDDSDMECELETSPAVSVDAVAEAVAHVKVIAASYVPSDSDIPEDSTFEAPLAINIPYGLQRGPQEPSDSYWSSRGMNITFPVSLQKAAEGHNGNGLASSMAARKRRKKWSAEEDEELIAAVKRHGEGSWATIAKEEFEGERTSSQLSQRWGSIKRRCDTSNSSTQSGLERTEAQMAANRALSLAVGNRHTSKKAAVGTPPVRTPGSITGAQANGANSGSSMQGQQQSQPVVQAIPRPVVQAIPRAATSVPTAKSRGSAKKTTGNSTSRSELMVTANSVAAAACMSGLATTTPVPKVEPGKTAVSALVPKAEPVINATPATTSLSRPSAISSTLSVEPVKNASPSATSFPRPSAVTSTLNSGPVKNASPSAASFPRPTGVSSAPNSEPVKVASATSLPRPSGISPALNAEPVKAASAASLPRPSGISSALNPEPVKAASAASLPRPLGLMSASKAEPVKTASAAFLPRPSGISAPKADPVKPASAVSLPRPSGIISAPKAEPVKTAPVASSPRPASVLSPPKAAQPVKSGAAAGPLNIRNAVNGSPINVIYSSPSNKPSPMAPFSKGPTIQNNPVRPSGFASSRLATTQRVPAATVIPQKLNAGAAVTATCKPVSVQKEQTQGSKASLVTTTLQPNKTISTIPVISTGKPAATKAETPSVIPKKDQVLVPEVGSCTNKSSSAKPPEKESSTKPPEKVSSTTVLPVVVAEAESKPKDEASKGKSLDVATVTGTVQKGL